MGVLQRFERRLEGLVEGAFAKVFKGVVEPVEIAQALQREAEDKKAILGPGRVLVPNDFVVELSESDSARLSPYAGPLGTELAGMVTEHAQDQRWHFVGPVRVRLERQDDLDTGVFRIRSGVVAAAHSAPRAARAPEPTPEVGRAEPSPFDGRPRVVLTAAGGAEQVFALSRPTSVLGRGGDADLRLEDTGVSRRHAELRLERRPGAPAYDVVLVDLGSTNGSRVNGSPAQRRVLSDGDRLELGDTALVFRRDRP